MLVSNTFGLMMNALACLFMTKLLEDNKTRHIAECKWTYSRIEISFAGGFKFFFS